MSDILNQKRQEVINALIDNLSSKNLTDLEACLNGHTIMTELTENEITFAKLIQRDNMVRLMVAASDIYNSLGQSYAMAVLAHIVKEYPDYERSISQSQA